MRELAFIVSFLVASIALVAAVTLSLHPWASILCAGAAGAATATRLELAALPAGPLNRGIAGGLWLLRTVAYACAIGYAAAWVDLGSPYLPLFLMSLLSGLLLWRVGADLQGRPVQLKAAPPSPPPQRAR